MENKIIEENLFQEDGAYANLVTGFGNSSTDKDEHTIVKAGISRPNYEALSAQYVKDGIVKFIANGPASKALKSPIIINDDNDDETFKALSKIGFFESVIKAGTWCRLFGGALVVELYDRDGAAKLDTPAPNGQKIVGYRVYSPGRIYLSETDLCSDPKSPYYGKVEIYPVTVRNGNILRIHASRCHLFKGLEVPDVIDSDIQLYVFGCSLIDMANEGLKKLPGAFGALSNMLQENGLSIFGMKGLSATLAIDGGIQKIRDRMSLVKIGMSTFRGVFQDSEDKFEMKSHTMSEIPECIKMIMSYVSALTGIPVSIIFGNMVAGLSSTNEGDIRQYDDVVDTWRNATLYRPMCAMITNFRNRNEGKSGEHDFQFGEVSQPTANEKADIRDKNSNFAKNMFDMGAMTSKEVRENLLVNGGTSEITVKADSVPEEGYAGNDPNME